MAADFVALQQAPGKRWAALRELCGADEQSVRSASTRDAVELLDRLLVPAPDADLAPGQAAALNAADRDRLLAALYARAFGPRIESTLRCPSCASLFDLDFSLPELVESLSGDAGQEEAAESSTGLFILPGGGRFRLPTGIDEFAVAHLPAAEAEQALLRRCVVEAPPETGLEAVQEAMAAAAPVLDLDLEARCPECGQIQRRHFDIQSYLFSALLAQREQLAYEVHRLAVAYGWSLTEILSLTRSQRQTYVALVEAENSRKR